MRKRLIAAIMAAVMVLGFSVPNVIAVTPADPLIASALYSFIISAGIKLFRDGGIAGTQQLVDDMMELYDDYIEDGNTDEWTLMGQGITTKNGNFILTKDAGQSMQSFTNWLANNKFNNTIGEEIELLPSIPSQITMHYLDGEDLSQIPYYAKGSIFTPIYSTAYCNIEIIYDAEEDEKNDITFYDNNVYPDDEVQYFMVNNAFIYMFSETKFNVTQVEETYTGQINTTHFEGIQIEQPNPPIKNNGNKFIFYYNIYPLQQGYEINCSAPRNSSLETRVTYLNASARDMAYIVLVGESEVSSGIVGSLSGSIARSVLDLVSGLADDQALAIDVGISPSVTQEELIEAITEDYFNPTSTLVDSTVAVPIPVEGVTELYPQPSVVDVNGLGLPDLGNALTSRFPFCIPFDFVNIYKSLNATPECPVIDVDLFPASFKSKIGISGDTSFTIDFGDPKYQTFILLIHWGTLVGFVLALAFVTKRLIWTTGG